MTCSLLGHVRRRRYFTRSSPASLHQEAAMSRLEQRQKERTRQAVAAGADIWTFLQILNDGRAEIGLAGDFDAARWSTHARLREHLLIIAQCLKWDRDAGARMWLADGTPAVDFRPLLQSHEGKTPRDGETNDAAMIRHIVAREMGATIRGFLQDRHWGAYRCLTRCECDACGRWFFTHNDNQRFCSPDCQTSAQPRGDATQIHGPRRRVSSSPRKASRFSKARRK
jgi:hypothetical protein